MPFGRARRTLEAIVEKSAVYATIVVYSRKWQRQRVRKASRARCLRLAVRQGSVVAFALLEANAVLPSANLAFDFRSPKSLLQTAPLLLRLLSCVWARAAKSLRRGDVMNWADGDGACRRGTEHTGRGVVVVYTPAKSFPKTRRSCNHRTYTYC